MKERYFVAGHRPEYSQEANELLASFDLGISGAFVVFTQIITVTFKDNATPEQIASAPNNIRRAYEELGCVDVFIQLVESEK